MQTCELTTLNRNINTNTNVHINLIFLFHDIYFHQTVAAINIHCVSKNDTDVAHYNFDADQPILIIFGKDVADAIKQ